MSWIVANIVGVVAGYVLCVVVPMPWLSRAILDQWSKLGTWIRSKTNSN